MQICPVARGFENEDWCCVDQSLGLSRGWRNWEANCGVRGLWISLWAFDWWSCDATLLDLRRLSLMDKRKICKKLFQTDLRKERSPYVWPEHSEALTAMKAAEKLPSAGFLLQQLDQPRMTRVDSYRAPPLKLTLETIEEDNPPEVVSFLRSKSLPAHRRASLDSNCQALHRFPSYRPGQGEYLPGACGVTMSGPILPSSYEDYDRPPKHRSRFSRVRDAIRTVRSGRLRQAFTSVLSRMRPASRRSH